MRIAYVANIRFPTEKAHGIQIAKMCEAFAHSGTELTLIPTYRGSAANPFSFYNLSERFQIKRAWAPGRISSFPGFLFSSVVFSVTSFFRTRATSPDIVYTMDIDPVSFLSLPFTKKPVFIDLHGPKKNSFINRFFFRKVHGVVTINETIKEEMRRQFPHLEDRVLVFPNGVDLPEERISQDKARDALSLPPREKIAVYTGSAQHWKGIDTALRAAKELPHVQFYFVGFTAAAFRSAGITIRIPSNVHAVGARPHKEMEQWRAAADLLLVTGTRSDWYSDKYTSPMKLFEYMGSHRPIVASRTPAIAEAVNENEVFFHEPDNAEDLVRTLEYALENKDKAGRKIAAAYERAKTLTWEKRAAAVLQFINEKK